MFDLSIKIKNYKCFKEDSGFDVIRRVNLIIGKNNAGKSSLLDLVEIVANKNYQFDRATWREAQTPQVIFSARVSKDVATKTFPSDTSGGPINGNHGQYGLKFEDRKLTWTKTGRDRIHAQLIHCDDDGIYPPLANTGDYAQRLPNNMPIPLEGKAFRRVLAERDILPEVDSSTIDIRPNGSGITNAIQCFVNRSILPSEVVETHILNALNEVFAHDATFTDIVCQLHENNQWEIYLEEQHKGRIALSQSGSGLKTIITVLVCLFIVPWLEKKSLDHYIFGFEELENNIHPALLRRLNDYIYRASVKHNFIYFLTTHSNVLIDQFSKQEDAQILHVKQHETISRCVTAKTYVDNNGILDDLDVRASDLLQANGIIWVEGPSDRAYINRWIQLWSDGLLREGTHYQIIFYGGRLLSHLSADVPESIETGISILNANRNAIIIMDSDKKTQQARINDTKRRVQDEFEKLEAICWITKGKEIENYIPSDVVNRFWGLKQTSQVGQYDSFYEYVDSLKPGEGTKYLAKKSLLAEQLVSHMTAENMRTVLDLDENMKSICACIRSWNS
ncbi:MAG: AAA family ATPase [Denitratisoma sp.]|nr:AAA family ATPase [Denitratisoma sp.]